MVFKKKDKKKKNIVIEDVKAGILEEPVVEPKEEPIVELKQEEIVQIVEVQVPVRELSKEEIRALKRQASLDAQKPE